jgi:DNA-binding response OmpR family regulator
MHRCVNCEKLQQQLDDVKQELSTLKNDMGFDNAQIMCIKFALDVKDQTAKLVYLLYKAKGRVLGYEYLIEQLQFPASSDWHMRHLYVVYHKAKKSFTDQYTRDDILLTVKNTGYAMSKEGIKFIDELLKD